MRTSVATAEDLGPPTPAPITRGLGPRARKLFLDRVAAVDPVLGGIGAVSFVVYVLHGFNGLLTRDLAIYTYAGQRFLDGDPPYVGIMNRAGPLAHVLPGIGIGMGRLVGISDVHGARAFYMLVSVACVCLVYVFVRDLAGSRAAGVVAATAFLSFQGFLALATNGPREKTPMVLFMLAALVAMLHRRWTTCGVLVALGTLTWQPVFFVLGTTVLVAAVLSPERSWRPPARAAAGGAATTGCVLLYFALEHALHAFFDGFLLVNAFYTTPPSAIEHLSRTWQSLGKGYGASLGLVGLGLLAVPVLAAAGARTAWRTREPSDVIHLSLGAGWLVGMIWTARVYNSWPDLLVMLPLAAIGIGALTARALGPCDRRSRVASALVLAMVMTSYAVSYSLTSRDGELPEQQAGVDAIVDLGPRPATMLSIQAPAALVLTHETNPSRYQMFDSGFDEYVRDTWPGGLPGYVAWIERTAPTYIVVQAGFRPPWLIPWLTEHYDNVAGPRQLTFWVTKTVSEDVRDTMEQMNQAARAGGWGD
jgi:hypothetical protein